MRGNGWHVLALALLVAVVLGFVITLLAGASRTLSAPDRFERWWGADWDAALEQQVGLPRTDEVAGLPSVERVEAATFLFAGFVPEGAEEPTDALSFAGSPEAVGARVVEGREARTADEFVATGSFIDLTGVRVGDELTVLTVPFEEAQRLGFDAFGAVEPSVRRATLVGRLAGPLEINDDFPIGLFPLDILAEDVGISATVSVVELARGATADDLREQLDSLADGDQFGVKPVEVISEELRTAVETQGYGLFVLAGIVGLAAVAVVAQLLSRQFRLDPGERGSLRALGYRPRDLVVDPLSRLAVPVGVGGVIAAGVAFALSGLFPRGFVSPLEPEPGLRFDAPVHIGAVLVGAAVVTAWTAIVLWAAERRANEPPPLPTSADRFVLAVPVRVATALRLSLVPIAGRRAAARASAIGFAVVVAGLLGAAVVGASVGRLVDDSRRQGSSFEYGIGQGGQEVSEEVSATLADDESVTGFAYFGTQLVAAGATSVNVVAMRPVRGDLAPMVLDGRRPRTATEIMLGRVTARDLGLDIGDRVELAGATGEHEFSVTGLGLIPSVAGADGVGLGGFLTPEGFARLDPDASYGEIGLTLADGSAAALDALSERLGVTVGRFDKPPAISNLDRIRGFPALVALALAALALLSLAHQVLVGVTRRTRDFAVLRALGAHRRWVGAVVHWQASVVAAVATVVAVPAGVVIGGAVFRPLADRIGAPTDVAVPFLVVGGVVAGLFLLANAAALVPAWRVRRSRPAAALRET